MGIYTCDFLWWDWKRILLLNKYIEDEDFMFKKIMVKFVNDERTTLLICKKKPKTKKKRIVNKWIKKFSYRIPDTSGCSVVGQNPTEDGLEVFAIAHPEAKPFMEGMNKNNDGKQPLFVFVEDL